MNKKDLNRIEKMPKVVLHIHLDGSLRPETVYNRLLKKPLDENMINDWFNKGFIFESDKNVLTEIARKGKIITLEEIKDKLSVDFDCRDLNEYLEKFALPGAVLQEKEEIEESVYELFEDLAKQNVIYAEVRFAPSKHVFKGLTQAEVIEAAINGMERAKKDFRIDGNLILCCMRGGDEEKNIETIEVANKFLNNGVVAVDLAGAEALFPAMDHKNLFDKANEYGIPITLHAGEADGPKSISDALKIGAKRIGHGVRCLENEDLVNELIKRGIPLEVCVTSNKQTQATKEPHPVEELIKRGLKVTLNTDNDTVSNTNIINEYKTILGSTNLTIEDILRTNINAASVAFTSKERKAGLLNIINKFQKLIEKEEREI